MKQPLPGRLKNVEMVYEGRLKADSGNERQVLHLPTGVRWLGKTAGILFSAVEHEGNAQCSDEEVERVAAIRRLDPTFDPQEFGTKFLSLDDLEHLRVGLRKAGLLADAAGDR